MKVKGSFWAWLCAVVLAVTSIPLNVQAVTVYVSDGVEHEEGYIIIGESHIVLTADAYSKLLNDDGSVQGLDGVYYSYLRDASVDVAEDGSDNTFTMSGNLFFVFQGNRQTDGETQYSKEYIYSDGKGNRGISVEKIHEIMENNPNIAHWNIISFQGAVSALEGVEAAEYYASSYENWITYEFPDADCYFMSHAIMTKYYKQNKANAAAFDEYLSDQLFGRWFDCTDYFTERYPQEMRDPNQRPDTIHWADSVYTTLFNRVIQRVQMSSSSALEENGLLTIDVVETVRNTPLREYAKQLFFTIEKGE